MTPLRFHWFSVGTCRHPWGSIFRDGGMACGCFPSMVGAIEHPDAGWILYDTGYSARFLEATRPFPERLYRWMTPTDIPAPDAPGSLSDQLARVGARPEDVKHVVLSHFHADHIAGLLDLPHAQAWCFRGDWQALRAVGRLKGLAGGLLPALLPDGFDAQRRLIDEQPTVAWPDPWASAVHRTPSHTGTGTLVGALDEPYDLLGDGSLLAVAMPGHARVQAGLLFVDQRGLPVTLCGDAVWSVRPLWVQDGRADPPWFTRRWLPDATAHDRTLARLRAWSDPITGVHVLPSHCAIAAHRFEHTPEAPRPALDADVWPPRSNDGPGLRAAASRTAR